MYSGQGAMPLTNAAIRFPCFMPLLSWTLNSADHYLKKCTAEMFYVQGTMPLANGAIRFPCFMPLFSGNLNSPDNY
jgi:hypothetical protein